MEGSEREMEEEREREREQEREREPETEADWRAEAESGSIGSPENWLDRAIGDCNSGRKCGKES